MGKKKEEELEQTEPETLEEVSSKEEAGEETAEPEVGKEEGAREEPSLEEKLQECEDRYLRVHADFENIKRRMEKEKNQAIAWANESFASDLLTVIDSLDMAIQIDDKEAFEKLKEGVELTKDNLVKTFEKHGIKEISTGEGFDPNLHEAVMQVDSEEHEANQIVQVLQKGYLCKEKVIRPTMVSISK